MRLIRSIKSIEGRGLCWLLFLSVWYVCEEGEIGNVKRIFLYGRREVVEGICWGNKEVRSGREREERNC